DPRDLAKKVARFAPGKTVDLTIVRDGKTITVPVALGKMPSQQEASRTTPTENSSTDLASLGLKLAPAEDGAGVKVTDVDEGSAAAGRGIRTGDVILEIAGKEVQTPADVQEALKAHGASNKK